MQIAKFIIYQARTKEDEPAIALSTGVATYGMLARAIENSVGRISALALKPNAIVVVEVKNPFHHVALLIALLLSGLTSASIQSRQHLALTGVTPDAIVTDASDFVFPGSQVILIDADWFLIDPARPVNYAKLLAMPGFEEPQQIIRVMFSSGTTGHPKAVAMTLRAAERRLVHGWPLGAGPHTRELRMLNLMGLSTLAGYSTPLTTLSSGGLLAFAPDIPNAVNLIRMFRIEILTAAVFQLNAIVKHLHGKPPLNTIRSVMTGGSRLPPRLLTAAREKLGSEIFFVYQTTEAGALSAARPATLEKFPDSAGHVLPWVTLEAVDAADVPVPAGQDGILRVQTDELAGYLNVTADPTERFGGSWFYPGDVGHVDPEGLVFITGRSSEIINRGGVIVAPDLIEEAILKVPGIKDAAVFGAVNTDGIEDIWAAVVSDQFVDANAVRVVVASHMSDRVPDRVVQVDDIPRNEMGKIKRKELRDTVVAKFGSGVT